MMQRQKDIAELYIGNQNFSSNQYQTGLTCYFKLWDHVHSLIHAWPRCTTIRTRRYNVVHHKTLVAFVVLFPSSNKRAVTRTLNGINHLADEELKCTIGLEIKKKRKKKVMAWLSNEIYWSFDFFYLRKRDWKMYLWLTSLTAVKLFFRTLRLGQLLKLTEKIFFNGR